MKRWDTRGIDAGPVELPESGAQPSGLAVPTLFTIGWRWKGTILLIGFLTAIAVYAALLNVPTTYSARTQVIIGSGDAPVIDIPNVVVEANANIAFSESAMIVMRSADVLRAVVEELNLDARKEFNPDLQEPNVIDQARDMVREFLQSMFPEAAQEAAGADGQDIPFSGTVRGLRRAVSTRLLGESQVIEIEAESTSPRLAAAIADAVAIKFIDQQLEAKFLAGGRATQWLQDRAAELRDVLNEAEQRVAAFRSNRINTGEALSADMESSIGELVVQIARLNTERSDLEARRDEIEILLNAGNFLALIEVVDVPAITDLHRQLSAADANISRLQAAFGEDYGEVGSLRNDRERVLARIRAEVGDLISGLEVRLDVVAKRLEELGAELQTTRRELAQRQPTVLQLRDLEREAEASREIYNRFLLRLKEARERSLFQTPDARIVSPAEVPVVASAPQRAKLTVIAAAGGSLLALLLVALFADNRPKVSNAQDISESTGVTLIQRIPKVRGARHPIDVLKHVRKKPDSMAAEAIRWLRLCVMGEEKRRANIIMVTSPLQGEGKSTLSLLLADLFSRRGMSTALVNLDPSETGLRRLQGNSEFLRSSFEYVDCSGIAAHTLESKADSEEELIERLTSFNQTEVVIIDAPAVLTSAFLIEIGPLADHTILTSAWEKTPTQSLRQCVEVLRHSGIEISVIAINKVSPRQMRDVEALSEGIVPLRT